MKTTIFYKERKEAKEMHREELFVKNLKEIKNHLFLLKKHYKAILKKEPFCENISSLFITLKEENNLKCICDETMCFVCPWQSISKYETFCEGCSALYRIKIIKTKGWKISFCNKINYILKQIDKELEKK